MPETNCEEKSETHEQKKSNNPFDLSNITSEIGKLSHEFDKLSKVFDYAWVELYPKIFKDNVEKAYLLSKKQLDILMGRLI